MPQLLERKKGQIMTLGTWGWSQLAAEFDTTQSNVSKLLQNTELLVKRKACNALGGQE